jgi:hypothetical protein
VGEGEKNLHRVTQRSTESHREEEKGRVGEGETKGLRD